MEGEGQSVGDEAAEWFSNYLKKPGYKMYQLSKHRLIQEDDDWGDIGKPGDKVRKKTFKLSETQDILINIQNEFT